tara:strand:+ start:492 stop:749 length:258 start_codon:yes stop_codon:yes gene_type:complete
MANPKKRRSRARTLLREQERETVTEVITKKVVVVEEPVVEEVIEEVIEEEPLDFSSDEQPSAASVEEFTSGKSALLSKYATEKRK